MSEELCVGPGGGCPYCYHRPCRCEEIRRGPLIPRLIDRANKVSKAQSESAPTVLLLREAATLLRKLVEDYADARARLESKASVAEMAAIRDDILERYGIQKT